MTSIFLGVPRIDRLSQHSISWQRNIIQTEMAATQLLSNVSAEPTNFWNQFNLPQRRRTNLM
jgi:hypothetical protein